jgi:hypothetical protein
VVVGGGGLLDFKIGNARATHRSRKANEYMMQRNGIT